MKKLELSFCDELAHIQSAAVANTMAFGEYRTKKDFGGIKSFFDGTKELFRTIDTEMTKICLEFRDQDSLVNWASRMRSITEHLDVIERNLPHAGSRLFEWEKVLSSMGLLLAFRVGAEQTIDINTLAPRRSSKT